MRNPESPYAELRAAALNLALSGGVGHVVTISPTGTEPGHFHDWSCSCGKVADSYFSDFGQAAGDAVQHVPADHTLVITRPNPTGGGGR